MRDVRCAVRSVRTESLGDHTPSVTQPQRPASIRLAQTFPRNVTLTAKNSSSVRNMDSLLIVHLNFSGLRSSLENQNIGKYLRGGGGR